jgi:UDP-N-acetylmuramoylalanine--D-glutamate ligase
MVQINSDYKNFFKGKKVTVHGLGLLGRGIGDVIFLAKNGANLIVTDLKNAEQLASSLEKIKKTIGPVLFKKIKFVLGEHRLEDFRDRDLIIRAANIPIGSHFIAEAEKQQIAIEQDASFFAKLAEPLSVKIIGVTGTRGKSTVTHLLAEILTAAYGPKKVWLGGNVRGLATLPLIAKVKAGDLVVMELDSWQLQGFGDSKISPNVSVFTNLMVDHQNYYKNDTEAYFNDKANIYRFQKTGDVIIAGKEIASRIKSGKGAGKLISISAKNFPLGWKTKLIGEHNRFNVALAIEAARALGVKDSVIKKVVANFAGVPGRLELVREIKGVKYYNDTTATTPDGVMAAVYALKPYQGKIILIGGGNDKELDYKRYGQIVPKYLKGLILFKGGGTDKILKVLPVKSKFPVSVVDNMADAMIEVNHLVKKGDLVLLSPGATSFGIFKNEFDRGDQFCKIVNSIR